MRAEEFISFEKFKEYKNLSDFDSEIIEFLKANKEKMVPIESKGYRTNAMSLWNCFINGTLEDHQYDWLVDGLLPTTFKVCLKMEAEDNKEKEYALFMDYLNNGFVSSNDRLRAMTMGAGESETCMKTGIKIIPVFTSPFSPVIKMRKAPKYQLEDPPEVEATPIQHMVFDCPSGNLIVADWIRIKEFSELYRKMPYDHSCSLESEAGKIKHALRALEQFKMLDISLTDGSVKIFSNGNQLMFGDDYDPETEDDVEVENFKKVGSICTDRWTLACIDRVHLERILATVVDDPKKTVDSYLKEKNYGVNSIQVEPGQYHVYFAGNYHEFNKKFKTEDFPLQKRIDYYVVMSDKELKLENEMKYETPNVS